MSNAKLSHSAEDYLKIIWKLKEWSDQPVSTTLLSETSGMRASTVSDAVKRLTASGLVKHAPYSSIALTPKGRKIAIAMVRRHRIIETFLVSHMGYRWDEVDDEAEHLEHAASDKLIDRMEEILDYPTRDPHGDPIPDRDGNIAQLDAKPLTEAPKDVELKVERISDSDPKFLRFLKENDIHIGSTFQSIPAGEFSENVLIRLPKTQNPIPVGKSSAQLIWVSHS